MFHEASVVRYYDVIPLKLNMSWANEFFYVILFLDENKPEPQQNQPWATPGKPTRDIFAHIFLLKFLNAAHVWLRIVRIRNLLFVKEGTDTDTGTAFSDTGNARYGRYFVLVVF